MKASAETQGIVQNLFLKFSSGNASTMENPDYAPEFEKSRQERMVSHIDAKHSEK